MSRTVETRDHYAVGHIKRAATLVHFITRKMGLPHTAINTINEQVLSTKSAER
jgi:hypothetical protein